MGDFTGALVVAEGILATNPEHWDAFTPRAELPRRAHADVFGAPRFAPIGSRGSRCERNTDPLAHARSPARAFCCHSSTAARRSIKILDISGMDAARYAKNHVPAPRPARDFALLSQARQAREDAAYGSGSAARHAVLRAGSASHPTRSSTMLQSGHGSAQVATTTRSRPPAKHAAKVASYQIAATLDPAAHPAER